MRRKENLNTRSRYNRGFTLIEILIVLIIVLVIAGVATPRFRKSLTSVQLSNTTQDIAQLMRFLRSKASTNKEIYELKFDFNARKYMPINSSGKAITDFGSARLIPSGIGIMATANPVKFYPDGSVDNAKVYLFIGKEDYIKDLETAINKEFDLGQIQTAVHTEYVYTIQTRPSTGRIEVIPPKED